MSAANPQNPGAVAGEAAIRKVLHDAATSLETIGRLAGLGEFMLEDSEVRAYANSRAGVVREALAELDRLRASQSDGTSGGWQSAPTKPTTEMIAAGMKRMFDEKRYSAPWDDVVDLMYRDMLAAAPSKSQGDNHGE